MGAILVPDILWVRILSGYACVPRRTRFQPKNKISDMGRVGSGTGWVQAGTKTKPNGVVSTRFLLLSYLISSPLLLDSLSSLLGRATRFSLSLPHFIGDGRRKVLRFWTCGDESCSDLTVYFFISVLNMKIRGKQNHKANILFFVLQCF